MFRGDCFEVLKTLEDHSIDALVTDPPAGISFMGKAWDSDKGGRDAWVNWMRDVMRECYRVMKPGAHGLVWAIPRTSHWTATALELAGFEVRDVITHLFGSGFPKSHDVSKAIDKAAGAEREHSKPATDAAKQWQGWGTALKPASEHWILIRKPLSEKTVAANVVKWGTGAIHIDACRIEAKDQAILDAAVKRMTGNVVRGNATDNFVSGSKTIMPKSAKGRFPANLVLSHEEDCEDGCSGSCAVAELDRQSIAGGIHSAGAARDKIVDRQQYMASSYHIKGSHNMRRLDDGGKIGASRFFYCAKASKKDRNAGLEGMPKVKSGMMEDDNYPIKTGSGNLRDTRNENHHPTVKATKLMEYLITLVTPPKGKVLDPFMGSGSTGVAAVRKGFQFVGIEQDELYFKIAEKRMEAVSGP